MDHPLAKLSRAIDWGFLEGRFGEVYTDGPGQPLPTRLMAGLAILKHAYDLSDEVLYERWVKNPYYQVFCGEAFFQHRPHFDRSSLTRWRSRMGEERLTALPQESLSVGSNDLTQLTLGVDRDSDELADLFDEQDEAVKWMIRTVIEAAHRSGAKVGLCGQALSDHPAFAEFLVACGIDSMSVSPDSFTAVKRHVAAAEAERRDAQVASTQEPPS
jgi:hypothetical protein